MKLAVCFSRFYDSFQDHLFCILFIALVMLYFCSWEASPWTDCSTTCDDGIQIRNISCLKEVAESLFLETTLDDCSELKQPETYRSCRQRDCFSWNVSSWSQVSMLLMIGCMLVLLLKVATVLSQL